MSKVYEVEKMFELSNKKIGLIRTQHLNNGVIEKSNVAETEDISFLPISDREPKLRQGFLKEFSSLDEPIKDLNEEELISSTDLDIIDAHQLKDEFFIMYRKLGERTLRCGIFHNDYKLKELALPVNSKLLEICTNTENSAYALCLDSSKYRLISYDIIQCNNQITQYEIFNSDRKKSCVFNITYENGELEFKLRKNFKLINVCSVKRDSIDTEVKLHIDSNFDYGVTYLENLENTARHLHIHLNSFSEKHFDEFDFLIDKKTDLLKIERDFSSSYLKTDISNVENEVFRAIKAYINELYSTPESISISAVANSGIIGINIIERIDKSFGIRVSGIIFKNLPANLISHKYTSNSPEGLLNIDDLALWKNSPMSKANSLETPSLIIAEKNKNDIWYGNSIAMYSSLKLFGKDVKCILSEKNQMKSQNMQNTIKKWLSDKLKNNN